MTRLIVRRALGGLVVLWLVSLLTFLLFFLAPRVLGANPAVMFAGRSPDPATVAAVTHKLGLDKPLMAQYRDYLVGIFAGRHFDSGPDRTWCGPPCLGYSFKNDQPVWQEIIQALPVTFSLAIGAAALWLVLGVGVGVLSAARKGGAADRLSMTGALAATSLPVFFTGLLALLLLSYTWPILPNIHYVRFTDNPLGWSRNLILPWFVLAFTYSALYARLARASMLETLGEDFIRTARAKGLPEHRVIGVHALRPTLLPIMTTFGLDLGMFFGSSVLAEQTFGFNGLGKLALTAVTNHDLPVILGVTIFSAFFIVVANIVVDLAYAVIDPRVRLR